MNNQNKWERIFNEFLELIEFALVKHKTELEDEAGIWSLVDLQGANLGDIESDRFNNAAGIVDRMEIYINDYFIEDIENLLAEKGIEVTWGSDYQEYIDNAKDLLPDSSWDFDVLDMICNHVDEINLENCIYEEEE